MSRRTHLMNDDVLTHVLSNLSIKQLLRLESVSEQFKDCVAEALKRKTGIRLGKKFANLGCDQRNHSIVGGNIRRSVEVKYQKYDLIRDLDSSIDSFALLLKRCPNIRSLYLSECRINEKVIQVIVDNCQHLECLTLVANYCPTDLEEWDRIAVLMARLNLIHLTIVGQSYKLSGHSTIGEVRPFNVQIDCVVKHLSSLKKLILFWYNKSLVELIESLPKCIESLHLIRCSQVSANQLSLLKAEHFPRLRELKVDLNFYGRNKESLIFKTICEQLLIEKLIFYADLPLEDGLNDMVSAGITDMTLKFYENNYSGRYTGSGLMSLQSFALSYCLKSFTIISLTAEPQHLKRVAKSFPYLESLTIKNYSIACICDRTDSDGESFLIWGHIDTDCYECREKAITYLARMKMLKRLRLCDHFEPNEIKSLKKVDNLSFLELRSAYRHDIRFLSEIILSICGSRKYTKPAIGLTLVLKPETAQLLYDSIIGITSDTIDNNLRIISKNYGKNRFDYSFD